MHGTDTQEKHPDAQMYPRHTQPDMHSDTGTCIHTQKTGWTEGQRYIQKTAKDRGTARQTESPSDQLRNTPTRLYPETQKQKLRHAQRDIPMPGHRHTEMCVQTHPAGLAPLSPTLGAPYLAYITPHVASAGAPMLAGLGQAGVHLLLTVAARAAFRAHAVVGIVLVHTLPTCLTQLFQPYPCAEESSVRHALAPPCLHRSQHHQTSLLASVTRVSRTLHWVVTQPPQLARCQSLTH